MDQEDSRRYAETLIFTTNLEHIGDIIDKNLMELAAKKIKKHYAFSPEGWAELETFRPVIPRSEGDRRCRRMSPTPGLLRPARNRSGCTRMTLALI
jgi:hypothetical protein